MSACYAKVARCASFVMKSIHSKKLCYYRAFYKLRSSFET